MENGGQEDETSLGTPSAALLGAVAKVRWAERHFHAIDGHVTTYLKACRDRTRLPTKIDPQKNTLRMTFEPLDVPPMEVSLMVGDCVHNIRCSLDHLWKCLGREDNFPIFGGVDGCGSWSAQRTGKLAGIDPRAHAIIDSLQPCHARDNAPNHPLSIINSLANHDKHQTIHLTWPRSRSNRIAFRERGSTQEVCVIEPPIVFHEQTELIVHGVPAGKIKPDMDVNIRGNLFVSFRDSAGVGWRDEPIQNILSLCIEFVKQKVFNELGPFAK